MSSIRLIIPFFCFLPTVFSTACASKIPKPGPGTEKDTHAAVSSTLPDSFATGKIIDSVHCTSDVSQSYALYIPAKGNSEALPVIYFFDPHGDGALPLNKYKSLADTCGCILIGSNNSKNGNDWSTTEIIWNHLHHDTESRLKINSDRVYTAGFSGGAKVASYIALRYPGVIGVIANGAALPDGAPAGDFAFSFTAVASEGDLNLTDLVATSSELDKTHTRHRIIFFDGKHEWAPVNTMELAFAGLQFDAMRQALVRKDTAFIGNYIKKSNKRLGEYYTAGQLIKAVQECRLSAGFLDGLTPQAGWFSEKAAAIAGDPLYQQQQQVQAGLLITEQNTKAGYMQHFQQPDRDYWVKTINGLQAGARAKTAESGMDQRLLAYLSLAFYSYSNHLVKDNANSDARVFVELYKIADPTNSEAWYLSAILHARNNEAGATENDLLKAAAVGFRDKERLLQQPEFKNLAPLNLSRIESKMTVPL